MSKYLSIIVILFCLVVLPVILSAQEQELEDLQVGIDTAAQVLADIPVSHFEDADAWNSSVSIDHAIIFSMAKKGRPLEVPEIDPDDGTENKYVLGVKVLFNQRGYVNFCMTPPKPIKIPGITKVISVWVCGRSFRHRLNLVVLDFKGEKRVLDMGLIDFVGWKKVSIAIPSAIKQNDYHNTEWRGLSFAGFTIDCDPGETYGSYYVYFDELRAISDVYNEEHKDEDDMEDGW